MAKRRTKTTATRPAPRKVDESALAHEMDRAFMSRKADNQWGSDSFNLTDALLVHAEVMKEAASKVANPSTAAVEIDKLADAVEHLAKSITKFTEEIGNLTDANNSIAAAIDRHTDKQ